MAACCVTPLSRCVAACIRMYASNMGKLGQSGNGSVVSAPAGANEITLFVVVEIKCALAGIENRLSNAARQVNVRRRDDRRIRLVVDGYDPMKRVFIGFRLLRVTRDIENFIPMRGKKAAAQMQFTGGILVVDPVTGLAQVFIGLVRLLTYPLPAPLRPDSTTLTANSRFAQFEACLIGIVDPFANEAVLAFRLLAQRRRARLLHLYTPHQEYEYTCRRERVSTGEKFGAPP